jgi:hypothetical protein
MASTKAPVVVMGLSAGKTSFVMPLPCSDSDTSKDVQVGPTVNAQHKTEKREAEVV